MASIDGPSKVELVPQEANTHGAPSIMLQAVLLKSPASKGAEDDMADPDADETERPALMWCSLISASLILRHHTPHKTKTVPSPLDLPASHPQFSTHFPLPAMSSRLFLQQGSRDGPNPAPRRK